MAEQSPFPRSSGSRIIIRVVERLKIKAFFEFSIVQPKLHKNIALSDSKEIAQNFSKTDYNYMSLFFVFPEKIFCLFFVFPEKKYFLQIKLNVNFKITLISIWYMLYNLSICKPICNPPLVCTSYEAPQNFLSTEQII